MKPLSKAGAQPSAADGVLRHGRLDRLLQLCGDLRDEGDVCDDADGAGQHAHAHHLDGLHRRRLAELLRAPAPRLRHPHHRHVHLQRHCSG